MTVAVTGATGFVGQALLDRAVAAGIEVRALARREMEPRKGVRWIKGDLANRRALGQLCKGVEAVIHVAGVVSAPDPEAFEAGNVAGTLHVVEAAVKAGVPRLIAVSSLAAREPGLSAYGASKARAELVVKSSPLDWTIVRPPGVYGPRDVDYLEMFKLAKRGVLPMPPKVGRSSMIHVDDLARLLLALIPAQRETRGQLFEPDDGYPGGWSHYDLARAIGAALGKRPLVLHLPRAVLDLAAKADKRLRGDNARLTADRVGYMTHPDWVSDANLRVPPDLWTARVETRQGLRSTAEWYREAGWL